MYEPLGVQDFYNPSAASRAFNSPAGQQALQGIGTGLGTALQKHRQKKQWQQTVSALMQNPDISPQMKAMLPLIQQNESLAGQLMPTIIKGQTAKPTTSIYRNTKTNDVSMSPQQGPDWMEESGLTPSQRQSALNAGFVGKQREKWANNMEDRTTAINENMLYNQINSLAQSPGSVLGQAANIQYRAERGEHLLATPGIAQDKLVYGLVKADLAAIAQGSSSPTLAAMAEASLPTIKEIANGVLRKITADPKSIDQPEVREQMRKIFQVMSKSAGSIISQNTEGVRALHENDTWFKAHPESIKKVMQMLGQGIKPFDVSKLPPLGNMPASAPSWDDTVPVGSE